MNTPLGNCRADRVVEEATKIVNELRRQAPAARMIGEFAVTRALGAIGERLRPSTSAPNSDR